MKHYPHHIGDFDRATRHLTRIERSVYRDLLDLYYDTEERLPLDIAWLCRKIVARSNEESTAVEQTLNEFFTKTPTGWYHERCEEEIAAYRANNSQRAQAGKASAAAKALKKQQALNGNSTHVEHPLESVATNGNGASTNQSTNQPINQSTKEIQPEPSSSTPEGFQRFWDEWPSGGRKGAKGECLKVWHKSKLEGIASAIVAHVRALKTTADWRKDGGQYIPAPLVYLRGGRWDGAEPVIVGKKTSHQGFAEIDYSAGVNTDGTLA